VTAEAIEITVEPYGVLDDLLGGPCLSIDVPAPHDVATLLEMLVHRFPAASATLQRTAVARDDRLLAHDALLTSGQSIALLPPVSGGQPHTPRLTYSPLDVAALMAETEDPTTGAVVVFGGTVRAQNRNKTVTAIDYSAYPPLAETAMRRIEDEIRARPDITACRVQHRVGRLKPGETSVYVVVRSGHRDAAFAAGRDAIDAVKAQVPIWKNEYFSDGTRDYVPGVPLDPETSP